MVEFFLLFSFFRCQVHSLMFFLSEGMMARQKKSAPRVHLLFSPFFRGWWGGTLLMSPPPQCGNFSFPVPWVPRRAGPLRTRLIKPVAPRPHRKWGGGSAPFAKIDRLVSPVTSVLWPHVNTGGRHLSEGRCPSVNMAKQWQKVVQLVQYYLKYIPPDFVGWVCWNSTVFASHLQPPDWLWLSPEASTPKKLCEHLNLSSCETRLIHGQRPFTSCVLLLVSLVVLLRM